MNLLLFVDWASRKNIGIFMKMSKSKSSTNNPRRRTARLENNSAEKILKRIFWAHKGSDLNTETNNNSGLITRLQSNYTGMLCIWLTDNFKMNLWSGKKIHRLQKSGLTEKLFFFKKGSNQWSWILSKCPLIWVIKAGVFGWLIHDNPRFMHDQSMKFHDKLLLKILQTVDFLRVSLKHPQKPFSIFCISWPNTL